MLPTHHRDLDAAELAALVEGLAARPDAWRHLVAHRPDARIYEQLHATTTSRSGSSAG